MEPAALNYDPHATVDSGGWCVPRRVGCMLPAARGAAGAALNFDAAATANDAAACVIARGSTSMLVTVGRCLNGSRKAETSSRPASARARSSTCT